MDVDRRSTFKETALHWACANGHLPVVEYLITTGYADKNATDIHGRTCLDVAWIDDQHDVVAWLMNFQAIKVVSRVLANCKGPMQENGQMKSSCQVEIRLGREPSHSKISCTSDIVVNELHFFDTEQEHASDISHIVVNRLHFFDAEQELSLDTATVHALAEPTVVFAIFFGIQHYLLAFGQFLSSLANVLLPKNEGYREEQNEQPRLIFSHVEELLQRDAPCDPTEGTFRKYLVELEEVEQKLMKWLDWREKNLTDSSLGNMNYGGFVSLPGSTIAWCHFGNFTMNETTPVRLESSDFLYRTPALTRRNMLCPWPFI